MEEALREAPAADPWRENLSQTVAEQRRKIGERIAGHRDRLRELEARIASQLEEVNEQVTRQHDAAKQAAGQADSKARTLEERQQQLGSQQADLEKAKADAAAACTLYSERLKELTSRETELASAKKAHDSELQKLKAERDALHDLENNLKLKEQSLADREQETRRQRRHVAQQFRAKKNELAAEAELNHVQAAASGAGQDLQLQLRLSELQGKYDRLREDYDARETQRDDTANRLAELKAQLDSRQREAQQRQADLEQAQRRQSEVESERDRLRSDLQRHLEQARQQAEASREDFGRHATEAQNQATETARLAAELERVRRAAQEEIDRFRVDHGQSSDAQVRSLEQRLDELKKSHAAEQATWQQTQRDLQRQLDSAKQTGGRTNSAELAALREENKQLESWLAEAEERAKQAGGGSGGSEIDDLKRRFELAVQDVRELKTKNAELTEQLSKAKQAGGPAAASPATGSDWESLKQKLLADLETDFDDTDKQGKADKLTVEGTIKITDQVVTEKEHEIQELRKLLESQSQQVGEVAVGAAVVAQMLDADELIKQERESLKGLQDNLREQLRQAEVDNSLERAKLARERAELEEKLRGLEAEKANLPAGPDSGGDKGRKAGGRKWLTRLGLGENKDQP